MSGALRFWMVAAWVLSLFFANSLTRMFFRPIISFPDSEPGIAIGQFTLIGWWSLLGACLLLAGIILSLVFVLTWLTNILFDSLREKRLVLSRRSLRLTSY